MSELQMKLLNKIINREIDGRWFLGGSHLLLVTISFFFFGLQRSGVQILFAYSVGFLTEFVCFNFSTKYKNGKILDRLFSAATESAGLLVLLKSHIWWFYGFFSFIAVSSKYLFRKENNSHIFNPTNFAITLGLTVFPIHWFGAWPDEYMLTTYPMIQVSLMGAIAVWLGRTYVVSLSYIAGLFIWLSLFFPMSNLTDLVYAIGPEFGAIGLIYLFLMITDPKTAPKNYYAQMFYGLSIALVHVFLRKHQLLYSRYVALFIVTLVYYFISNYLSSIQSFVFKSSSR
jgi:hypothetical protein